LEKVFIGQRIRDIGYYSKNNLIVLALEESSEIAILFKN